MSIENIEQHKAALLAELSQILKSNSTLGVAIMGFAALEGEKPNFLVRLSNMDSSKKNLEQILPNTFEGYPIHYEPGEKASWSW